MPGWSGSSRRDRLPSDWPKRRAQVLKRDGHRCQLRYRVCLVDASEVDHRRRGDDHSLGNLQAACKPCHLVKSGREGAQAAHRSRSTRRARPVVVHPGRLAAAPAADRAGGVGVDLPTVHIIAATS